ncbi:MAG: HAD family hydrolase [Candidatus Berkiellales bacterium]
MTGTWLFIDFDNTLMATEQTAVPSLIARFNELYQKQIDHALTFEEFKIHFHGQARETLCENLSRHFKIKVEYRILYDQREWRIMQHLQQLPDGIEMAPHAIDTLQQLTQQGVNIALVSNNPIQRAFAAMRFARDKQGDHLAALFKTNFFEAGDIQKPKPDVYLHAIEQVNAHLENSFAIEDSITGATSATSAGLKTFGFTGFSDHPEELKSKLLGLGCIDVFHSWEEFPALLASKLNVKRRKVSII